MVRWLLAGMTALAPASDDAEAGPWWEAPASCPDAAAMTRRIAALVPAGATVPTARVRIVETGDGVVATIEIERGTGPQTRVIEGESCEAIADAVALVIAIGSEEPDEPAPAPAVVVDTPPPSTPTERPTPAPARTPTSPLRIGFFVGAGITWRTVPAVGPTIAGGIALLGARWRAELAAIGTTPTRRRLPAPNEDVQAEVASGVAVVRGAYVPRLRTIELPVFGGIETGGVSAISRGAVNADRRVGLLAALQVGAGLMWAPIPALALRIEVAGVLALARPRFAVHTPSGDATAFETPRLGLRALVGVEARIPVRRGRGAETRSR